MAEPRTAFCFVHYRTASGAEEVLWNAREGEVPNPITSSAGELAVFERLGQYAPDHVPAVGDRVIVDLTETRARVMAGERIERLLAREREGTMPPPGMPRLDEMYDSREAAVQDAFESIYEHAAPDILVVTAGWLEQLAERSGQALPLMAAADPVHVEPQPAAPPAIEVGRRAFFYDRQGQPMFDMDLIERRLRDRVYKRVAETQLADVWVSTVWLGTDYSYGDGPPVIFETMTFKEGTTTEVEGLSGGFDRYCTEAEALAGHARIVAHVEQWLVGRREQAQKRGN